MAQGEWSGSHPGDSTTTIAAANIQKPTQESSLRAANIWLRFARAPVVSTSVTCTQMKNKNQTMIRKGSGRAAWMLSTELTQRMRVDSACESPSPVRSAAGAAMKTVKK
jgi:hypothetical protein